MACAVLVWQFTWKTSQCIQCWAQHLLEWCTAAEKVSLLCLRKLFFLQDSFKPIACPVSGRKLIPQMVDAISFGQWDFTDMHTALLCHQWVYTPCLLHGFGLSGVHPVHMLWASKMVPCRQLQSYSSVYVDRPVELDCGFASCLAFHNIQRADIQAYRMFCIWNFEAIDINTETLC